MRHHLIRSSLLKNLIRRGEIKFAGNMRLKIYGLLKYVSGKRMKRENRLFFKSEEEARMAGFRPCGRCMAEHYKVWKRNGNFKQETG